MFDAVETDRGSATLAERAASTTYRELAPELSGLAARVLVDTLAVARAGSNDPFCAAYTDRCVLSGAVGPASLVRGGTRVATEQAAFLNAVPTTVLQIDEGHRVARGHPAIHVVPAALAVAEEVGASGEDLIEAVVAGYEVAVAVAAHIGAC